MQSTLVVIGQQIASDGKMAQMHFAREMKHKSN
jgi:hypothetical protein